jgi:predicted RNase H-like nuclease (RuvC/YqgF family)
MDDALKNCEAEVERLELENRDLRRSSEEFGELAERLNRALRERLTRETGELKRDRRDGT